MRKVEKTRLTLFLLIIVVECCYVFCDGIRWTKYVYNDEDNQRCLPSATTLEAKAPDPIACGRMSHFDSVSDSFHYQPDTHQCTGCRYKHCVAHPLDIDEENGGSSYFLPARNDQSDCKDILRTCPDATSGTYDIKLWNSKKILKVYCDMETAGGGWTVFQNRFNGSVDFYKNFSEYENGFGVPEGEFWLGVRYVQEIADQSLTEIRVVLSSSYNNSMYHGYEEFQGFHLSGPNYTLRINTDSRSFTEYTDNEHGPDTYFQYAYYSLEGSNGYGFSTFDQDRDQLRFASCAGEKGDAHWYGETCSVIVHLHGAYDAPERFVPFGFGQKRLNTSRLMLRRV